MANMPDVKKVICSFQLPLELLARLRKLAMRRKISVSRVVNSLLNEELAHIVLCEEDYAWIQREVLKNEQKRKRNR